MLTERLILRNFQCYSEQEFSFPVGQITAIIGDTDVGKTAIFRCLEWLLENKNSTGDLQYYRKQGTSAIEAAYTFADGVTLKRRRGDGENVYSLLSASDELTASVTARGGGVPDEISKRCLTRPSAKIFDDTSLLMCTQRGASFFIGGGKTTAYELLLHLIDISRISDARQDQRKIRDDLSKQRAPLLSTVLESCNDYSLMLGLDDDLDRNLDEQQEIRDKLLKLERLEKLQQVGQQFSLLVLRESEQSQSLSDFRRDLIDVKSRGETWGVLLEKLSKLISVRDRVETYRSQLICSQDQLTSDRSVLETRCEYVSGVQSKLDQLKSLLVVKTSWGSHSQRQGEQESAKLNLRAKLDVATQALETFLEEVGVCPTCGQVICSET